MKSAPLEDLAAARRQFNVIRREWNSLASAAPANPEVALKYAEAEAAFTARDTAAQEEDQRARREALTRLQQLVGRIEPVAARSDLSLKTGERALKDIRTALGTIPQLPVEARLRRDRPPVEGGADGADAQGAGAARRRRLAALGQRRHPGAALRKDGGAQGGRGSRGDRHARCATCSSSGVRRPTSRARRAKRCGAGSRRRTTTRGRGARRYFAAQNEARAENLAKKVALSERAEALAESTNWIQTADEIKKLQAEWKTIGPVSRGQEKAIWERFRAACDRFFTRRHADLAERKTMWAENLAKKNALCVKVEALRDSTDWDATAGEIKRLQAEWKTIGPVKKTRSEAIWQRFRGACDEFFARYAQRHDIARGERLAAREAIVAELEGLAEPVTSRQSSVVSPESSVVSPEPLTVGASLETDPVSPESGAEGRAPSVENPQSAVESPQSAVESPQSAVESPQSAVESPQSAVENPQSAIPDPQSEEPPADLVAKVRSLRGRWQAELAARGVERDRAAALDLRFATAFSRRARAVARGVRRHRSRSRREPQADGSARAPDGGSGEIARRAGVRKRRCRVVPDHAGSRRC